MPDRIDVLYLAWNRREFVTRTFAWLVAHTDWRLAGRLVVYDDGSEDGTQEWLREAVAAAPCDAELRVSDLRSPPAIMNHYLATTESDMFAKIDCDIAVPPRWLNRLADVMGASPDLELLGMEAGMVRTPEGGDSYSFVACSHIGGVGLMRTSAFRSRPRIPERGRFGFGEWQNRYRLRRGWITPDLCCPQLDRLPFEPYLSLSEQYVEEGWQRAWPKYDEQWTRPYWEWLLPAEEPVQA